MTVTAGTKLGKYEILAPVGRGGTGEVYRAADTKLNREVAVKVLSERVAQDAESFARFRREAQLLAALNHPNIAHIYGVEENALIMEFVEGLAPRGPIDWNAAWKIASQIIDALDYAHERGIIHRDLKPANIRVTREGRVKLLDFGLAKSIQRSAAFASDPENSPTLADTETRTGVVLGTPGYMAPEQARGQETDRRSDIWAFGLILFELLSGRQAFTGKTTAETLAMVLKDEPDWNALPASTPARVKKLIQCCLAKDPGQRFQAIRDVRLFVEFDEVMPKDDEAKTTQSRQWRLWIAMAVLAAVAGWGWLRPQPQPQPAQSFSLTIQPPKGIVLPNPAGQIGAPLLSPDGRYILAGSLLRNLNAPDMTLLKGMQGLSGEPFWSPDSKWIAFPVAGEGYRKLRVPDGAPEQLTQGLPGVCRGGTWNSDGTIVIACIQTGLGDLFLLPPNSNTPTRLPVPEMTVAGRYFHPEFLPGGSDLLFVFHKGAGDSAEGDIYLGTLAGAQVINLTRLMQNTSAAHFTPYGGGHLLFVRSDNLYAQPLNVRERRLEGDPVLLERNVASNSSGDALAAFSVDRAGLLAWRAGVEARDQITVFDRKGQPVGTFGPPGNFAALRLSPDEAYVLANGVLLERDKPSQTDMGPLAWFLWFPSGSQLLGRRDSEIIERAVAGTGDVRVLANHSGRIGVVQDISPDGKTVVYGSANASFQVRLDNGDKEKPRRLFDTDGGGHVRFSPDAKWIVYQAPTGPNETAIFVQPFPGPGLRKQVAPSGTYPVWRKDGKEILFVNGKAGRIVSIPVQMTDSDVRFGPATNLFPVPETNHLVTSSSPLAVTRDGSRIIFPRALQKTADENVIQVRSGWHEMKR